jgi:hypothetical protein
LELPEHGIVSRAATQTYLLFDKKSREKNSHVPDVPLDHQIKGEHGGQLMYVNSTRSLNVNGEALHIEALI